MKKLIFAAAIVIFIGTFGCFNHGVHASESGLKDTGTDHAITGNERCDVHQRKCDVEDIEIIVMHGPSYPESYWQARRSEEYRRAVKVKFPNANSALSHAVPGTSHAKQKGGKMIKRFYCTECREEEKKWHARWQEKQQNNPEVATPK